MNDGDYAVSGARYSLDAPAGWQVRPLGPAPATIAAGQTVTVRLQVTVPESAQGSQATLTAWVSSAPRPFGFPETVMQTTASVAVQALAGAALSQCTSSRWGWPGDGVRGRRAMPARYASGNRGRAAPRSTAVT